MKVNTNRVVFIISSLIFVTALWVRWSIFADVSSHGRYYFASIITISGFMVVITLLRLIKKRPAGTKQESCSTDDKTQQRRGNFRIKFDPSEGPIFIRKTDDHQPDPTFTCSVIDISETGIGLACTGVYAKGQTVLGEIIFDSGRTAPVNGVVVREGLDGTFFNLHCTIAPPLLMKEQREQIQRKKAKGPLPKAGTTSLDAVTTSLPSHTPKGVCRLKRP